MAGSNEVALMEIVGVAGALMRKTFRVALTAKVRDFARDVTRADVDLTTRYKNTANVPVDEPPVPDLPVLWPGGGGYVFAFDLRQGDLGLAVACDGPVRGTYETGDPVTPTLAQGHDFGCAVVVPGGRVSSSESPTAPPNAAGEALVGAADGSATVIFRGAALPSPAELGTVVVAAAKPVASVLLGGPTAAEAVAVASAVLANLQALNNLVQAWVPVPNDGGASLKAVLAGWIASLQPMGDLKVMVEGPGP